MGSKVVPPTSENPVITAVFDGYLNTDEGVASAEAFRAAFRGVPLQVVWDVSKMLGFEGGARAAWAEAVWPLRGEISQLKTIGARGMARIGATSLALLLGKPYEFVDSDGAAASSRE